jgi:hypothetical protein
MIGCRSQRSYIDQNDQAFHEAHKLFGLQETAELTRRTRQSGGWCVRFFWHAARPRLCDAATAICICAISFGYRLACACLTRWSSMRRIATGDVLYDLAFLLMDLDQSGERQAANRVLNRYLALRDEPSDFEALAAMPLFLSIRAALRAKICAMGAQHLAPLQKLGHGAGGAAVLRLCRRRS